MPTSPDPRHRRWHRALIATVLVVGVLLMGGPPATAAAGPADPMSGMVMTHAAAEAVDVLAPATPPDGVLLTACAVCVDMLEACLAVLGLVVAAALAGPGVLRLVRAEPSLASGRAHRWAVGESPPWSVPSLSQLSVLRV